MLTGALLAIAAVLGLIAFRTDSAAVQITLVICAAVAVIAFFAAVVYAIKILGPFALLEGEPGHGLLENGNGGQGSATTSSDSFDPRSISTLTAAVRGRGAMTGFRSRFLHLSFTLPWLFDMGTLEAAFNAGDGPWLRYARNCWIVQTSSTTEEWRERIRAIPGLQDQSILIIEFNPTTADGYMPEWAWKWLHTPRTTPPKVLPKGIAPKALR
jgi:hypothetical protein